MDTKKLSEENRKIYEKQLLNKTGFLEEEPHVKSSTRLAFITGVWAVILMAGYMCYKGNYTPIDIGIFLGAGVAAFGGTKYFGTKNVPMEKKE